VAVVVSFVPAIDPAAAVESFASSSAASAVGAAFVVVGFGEPAFVAAGFEEPAFVVVVAEKPAFVVVAAELAFSFADVAVAVVAAAVAAVAVAIVGHVAVIWLGGTVVVVYPFAVPAEDAVMSDPGQIVAVSHLSELAGLSNL